MKKIFSRLLSTFMATTFLFAQSPVLAQEIGNALNSADVSKVKSFEPEIVEEVVSKREECTKHFLMSDNSMLAVVYSDPVHYKDNDGIFKEIDNSLTENEDEYQNTDSPFKVKLSKNLNNKKLVAVNSNGHEISWNYIKKDRKILKKIEVFSQVESEIESVKSEEESIDFEETINDETEMAGKVDEAEKKLSEKIVAESKFEEIAEISESKPEAAQIENFKTRSKKFSNKKEELTDVSKNCSIAKYKNADPEIDFDYTLSGLGLKENIILNKKLEISENDSFDFEFKTNGLKVEKDNTGNLNFKDGSGQIIFVMSKGSMWDSGESFSNDVDYKFRETDGGYVISVIPNFDWINDPERLFPIFIDPSLTWPYPISIVDTMASQSNPSTNYATHDHLPVGRYSANDDYISYVKFGALPTFSHGEIITSAIFKMYYYSYITTQQNSVYARKVISDWDKTTLTWNNKPNVDSTIIDYVNIDAYGTYALDITKLMKESFTLENPNSGNGIALSARLAENGQNGISRFVSSSNSTLPSNKPTLEIKYRNFIGEEPYWSYTNHSAGLHGAGKVNNYAGTLSLSENILAYSGSRNPVSVVNTYNSPYFNKQPNSHIFKTDFLDGYSHSARTGLGWSLDFNQLLYEIPSTDPLYSVPEKWRYLYIDDDGTWHYFREMQIEENGTLVTKVMDEDGLYFEIKSSGSNLEIVDKGGNKLTFSKVYGSDACFNLINSQDFCGNTTTYNYDKEPGTQNSKISRITDAAGRETHVAYDLTHGMVSEITETDGRITKFIYDGEKLSEIIYPDEAGKELKTGYIYDERGRLARVWTNAGTGSSVAYAYASNSETSTNFFKVRSVTEFGSQNGDAETAGNSVQFDYEMNQTKISHKLNNLDVPYHKNATTWIFDDHGRIMSVMDEDGEAMAQVYRNEEENIDLDPDSNYAALCAYKIKHMNGVHKYANNLLKNSAATRNLESWTVKDWIGNEVPQIEASVGEASLGEKSFKVENNANNSWPIAQQKISIVPSKSDRKFTFSADVKIDGTLNDGSGAALHLAAFKGEFQKAGDEYSEWLKSTGDNWRRISVTINVPADADSIKCYFGIKESIGTAYFDCLQLEENEFASDYNLIENSSFDSGLENWGNVNLASDDKVIGGRLKINGSVSVNKAASQIIPINKVNPVFTVSATGEGTTVPNNVNKIATNPNSVTSYGVKLGINFADNTQKWVDVYFNPSVSGPQRTCGSVSAKDYGKGKVVTSIEVRPAFYSNCNTVYFDEIQVCTGDFGWSAEYDKNTANAETVTNNLGKETDFGYTAQNEVSTETKVLSGSTHETTSFGYTDTNPRNLTSRTSPIVSGNTQPRFTYDTYGNILTASFGDDSGSPRINSATEYTANKDYNYPEKITDSRGFETLLNYNKNNGNLDSVTNANNVTASYTYDTAGRMVSASCCNVETNYEYSNGVLSKIINSMGTTYNFVRDMFGKITQSKVGEQVLLSNKYDAGNGLLKEVKYNNNQISRFDYDKLGRMIKKQNLAGKVKTESEYTYDDKNRLVQLFDSENNLTIKIEYDKYGRISHIRRSDNVSSDFTFDNDRDSVSKAILKLFGLTQTIENTFGPSGILEKSKIKPIDDPNNQNNYIWSKYTYDELGRIKFKDASNFDESTGIRHEISYASGNLTNSTTGLIESIQAINIDATLNKKFSYEYDNLGNISIVKENNVTKIEYFYDDLNQLKRENNAYLGQSGQTIIYEYDLGGNILKKEIYAHTAGSSAPSTLERTATYSYNDSNWKDKLSSYHDGENEHKIIYDGIGNPTQYRGGWNFEWKNGKRLGKAINSCYNIEYKYDDGGIRTQKTVNGMTTDFVSNGIQVLGQKTGDETIIWQMDGNGSVVGFNHNDEQYFYIKNAQSDIVGITDATGTVVAEYTYDSWGKLLNTPTGIGTINPLRYRGYYYDSETGLYYLNARYYDPETGRFISADDNLEGGLNLFAYCYNNPIMFADYTGLSGILQIFSHPDHAWIAYTDSNGNTQTIGTWGGGGRTIRRGVNYGVEDYFIKTRGAYDGRVSLSANIDDTQEKNLLDFIAKNNKWEMFYNCSSFATDAWSAAGQKAISNKALGIIPTPAALARNIKTVEGYQINAPTAPVAQTNPQQAHSSSNPLSVPYDSSYLLGIYFPNSFGFLGRLAEKLIKFI